MKTSLTILTLLLFVGYSAVGQGNLSWKTLEVVKLKEVIDSANHVTFDAPVFNTEQKQLHNEKVTITGFLVRIDSDDLLAGSLYMLQRYNQSDYGDDYPLDGIIEIQFKKEPSSVSPALNTTVKGILELNDDDFMHPFYILKKAKIKSVKG